MHWLRTVVTRPSTHLVALIVLTLLKSAVWIAMLPPFLVADEPSHFDNVQYRAEHHRAPQLDGSARPMSKTLSDTASPEARKLWVSTLPKDFYRRLDMADSLDERLVALAQTDQGRDTNGQTTSMGYPGAYYRLSVVFYDAFRKRSVVTRIMAVRCLSLLFGLCAVIATYLAARMVVDDLSLAFVAAALVALQPMESQMCSAVNNDAGVIGISALLYLFQVRAAVALPAMPPLWSLVGMALTSILLVYTKPTGYGILPGVAFLAIAIIVIHRRDRRVQLVAGAGLLLAAVLGGYLSYKGLLPTSLVPGDTDNPGQHGFSTFPEFLRSLDTTYRDYLLRSAWGQFGWLDYSLDSQWLPALRSAYTVIEIGTVVALVIHATRRDDERLWFRAFPWAFGIATTFVGVTFILYAEHRFRLTGLIGVIQGRNFLFVLPAFAIWAVVAIGALIPARLRGMSAAMIFTGALWLNYSGLLTIFRQHYVR